MSSATSKLMFSALCAACLLIGCSGADHAFTPADEATPPAGGTGDTAAAPMPSSGGTTPATGRMGVDAADDRALPPVSSDAGTTPDEADATPRTTSGSDAGSSAATSGESRDAG